MIGRMRACRAAQMLLDSLQYMCVYKKYYAEMPETTRLIKPCQEDSLITINKGGFNREVDVLLYDSNVVHQSCSPVLSSPGSVWAWRPASAARCSPPPARCSPAADEPPWTCTPWCHHAADSSGAPPSGCSVGQQEEGLSVTTISISFDRGWERWPWLDIVALV